MSTTHKHTPGPWQYAKGHAPHFQTVVWPEGDGRAIATCYDDETEANARLIATAPELLAALEAVIAYTESH